MKLLRIRQADATAPREFCGRWRCAEGVEFADARIGECVERVAGRIAMTQPPGQEAAQRLQGRLDGEGLLLQCKPRSAASSSSTVRSLARRNGGLNVACRPYWRGASVQRSSVARSMPASRTNASR
jgi:hypothetical protein